MTVAQPSLAYARAAIDGRDEAVDTLAKVWLPTVYSWCHRLGGPGVDSESAAHDVLLVMCRRIGTVQSPEQFPAWLFSTCRRVIANHRRKAWLKRWVPGPIGQQVYTGPTPEQLAQQSEAAQVVWAALDKLAAGQREVLVLCELEERSGSEAAALLGLPLGTVKSRLRAARKAFRSAVEASRGGCVASTERSVKVS